ncbi:MAG: hypothetical protein ABUT20_32055 [Bacteroidota bacterium]
MKNFILILSSVLFITACNKSSDSSASKTPKITIQSATQTVRSGITVLDMSLNFENAPFVSSCQLIIYKTDASSIYYTYDVVVKDGVQVLECSQYGAASPMLCQFKYILHTGEVVLSDIVSQPYN